MNIPSNTTVTISFDLEMTVNTPNPTLQVYNSNVKGPKTFDGRTLSFTASVGSAVKQKCTVTTILRDQSSIVYQYNTIEFYSTYGTSNWYKISNVKLEKGNKATDWTPAPEDVDQSIVDVDNAAKGYSSDAVSSATDNAKNYTDSSISTARESITSEISQSAGNITYTFSKSIEGVNQNITDAADAINGRVDTLGTNLGTVESYFDFSSDGLVIGKVNDESSQMKVKITNTEMDFMDNGKRVAYINKQHMEIDNAKILSSIIVGNHQIEKYNTDITIIKWVGEGV